MNRSTARLAPVADVFSRLFRSPRLLVLSLILLLISGFIVGQIKRPVASSVFASAGTLGVQTLATMSDTVTVHAAGRGKPYINFSDGHDVLTGYTATSNGSAALQSSASPLAMASADFDEDGVPDLVSGYSVSAGGILILHRGNVDSVYPNAPEAQQRRATGVFTDAPFLSPARVFDLPEAADFVGAGDFDADGHCDVVIANRGDNALHFLAGDGEGNFGSAQRIELPGRVTAMATGEVNRADGLIDVVVGVATAIGARALVFESPEGALRGKAESFDLTDEATAIAIGNLDAEYTMDIAIAAGRELMVINGRDRKLSLDEKQQATVPKARTGRRGFSFGLKSVAIGDFKGDHNVSLAVLTDQGSVHLLSAVSAKAKKKGIKKWKDEAWASGAWAQATQMVSARVSSAPSDDLVIVDPPSHKLHIVANAAPSQQQQAHSLPSVSFDVEDEPMAVMPMRLNPDALSDLVILRDRQVGPTTMTSLPSLIFTVNTNADNVAGSLRDAINQANTNPGLDEINFAIGTGPQTISPTSSLPAVTEPVIIDGTTQPGFAGSPIIEINGSSAGGFPTNGFDITAGNCTVRGLVINRFPNRGIHLTVAGNNVVEGNFLGTDINGTADLGNAVHGISMFVSPNNTIGGLTAGARNVISGNNAFGVSIENSGSTGNQVFGNFIGTDVNGTAAIGNLGHGVLVTVGSSNAVGGTSVGAKNLIAGNGDGVRVDSGAAGNLVQGNLIGTDVNGTAALGNSIDGVFIGDAPNNTIGGTAAGARNILSGNGSESGGSGVDIFGANASGNQIQGNFIGTDVTGNFAMGNFFDGVALFSPGNVVGGATPAARNVISGNGNTQGGSGVAIFGAIASGNQIQGNFVGTDVTGNVALGNVFQGVALFGPNNIVGGTTPGAGNLISGNGQTGVTMFGSGASGNVVQGNFIGTNATGTSSLGNQFDGVFIQGANNMIGGTTTGARNVISGNGAVGVNVRDAGATGNLVQGNFIGTDITGSAALGNTGEGVLIQSASNNTIGGTTATARNVISGNGIRGILISGSSATGNQVQGNLIGTDVTGSAALGNTSSGISINGPGNTIGGTTSGARNVISGNVISGVVVGFSGTGNIVQGNFIGTDVNGTTALGNGGNGIIINGPTNIIGGTTAGAGNVISGNVNGALGTFGPQANGNMMQGNFIGTDITGQIPLGNGGGVSIIQNNNNTVANNTIAFNSFSGVQVLSPATGNAILSNSIFSNADLGIDLNTDGVTPNDSCDGDTGANNLQNYPVLTVAFPSGNRLDIRGTLNSTANTTFTVQFFASSSCDPSGFGEGQTPIGSTQVTTDASCNASFTFLAAGAQPGQSITATATDPAGNTSEFSNCIAIGAGALNLALTKSVSPTAVRPGNNVTYTITVTNNGPAIANNVVVTDNLPAQVTFVSCSSTVGSCGGSGNSRSLSVPLLALNGTATLTLVATVSPSVANGTVINNTATVTASLAGDGSATATASAAVTVSTQAPAINCPPNVLAAAAQGQASAVVNYPAPTVAGNPANVTITCTPPSGSSFPVGTTTVNCKATDAATNTSSCSFSVTVNQGNPSVDKTTVDFGNPIAVPNQNPPTDTFTITNASTASINLTLASIRRTGSDVGGRITNPDDSGFFTVFAINPGGADMQLSLGSTITIPPGQRTFRVTFNPSIPAVASGTSNLSANQVLPDVITSSLNFNSSVGGSVTVNMIGRVATGLLLIDPANPTRSPVVTFTKSGNQFNLTYSVFDSNLNVTRASHQFLDSGGQPSGQPIDVNLAQALQAINLVKGQSFTVDQPFTGASSHPEIAGVRVTVFDGETSVSATASGGGSQSASARIGEGGERITMRLSAVRLKRRTGEP